MKKEKIEQLRKEYEGYILKRDDLCENPIDQFQQWFDLAIQDQLFEPHAMTLSTLTAEGKPNSRTVLLKDIDEGRLIFVTSSLSKKGKELAENPYVSLTFWFREHYRQINIQGDVIKLSKEQSEKYFFSRPRGSQIAAWIPQSAVIESRKILEKQYEDLEKSFSSFDQIPCPHFWCAYSINPSRIEFWQGRVNRLHDRFEYIKHNNSWNVNRLSP